MRSLGSVRALFQSSRALFSIPVPVLPRTRTLCVCMCIHTRTVENHDRSSGTRPRRFSSTRDGDGCVVFFICVWDTILFTHTHTHHRSSGTPRAGHPDRAGRFFTRLDSARGVPLAHDGGGASKKRYRPRRATHRDAEPEPEPDSPRDDSRRRIARASDRSIDDESNRTVRAIVRTTRGKRETERTKRTWRRHRARRWTTRDSARS